MSRELLAYIAGFFDGEGCIYWQSANKGKNKYPRVNVGNSCKEPINLIKSLFKFGWISHKTATSGKDFYE